MYDFPNIIDKGLQYLSLPWERCEKTHSAFMRGMSSVDDTGTFMSFGMWRSLVARTAGGREVASSSLVIPTN